MWHAARRAIVARAVLVRGAVVFYEDGASATLRACAPGGNLCGQPHVVGVVHRLIVCNDCATAGCESERDRRVDRRCAKRVHREGVSG